MNATATELTLIKVVNASKTLEDVVTQPNVIENFPRDSMLSTPINTTTNTDLASMMNNESNNNNIHDSFTSQEHPSVSVEVEEEQTIIPTEYDIIENDDDYVEEIV